MYHIPLSDVSLSGAQVSILESLLAVDLLPYDLQPLDRAANNGFRWVARRLSRVHVPAAESIPAADVIRFRPSTVGSRGIYVIPPAPISLTNLHFLPADLL